MRRDCLVLALLLLAPFAVALWLMTGGPGAGQALELIEQLVMSGGLAVLVVGGVVAVIVWAAVRGARQFTGAREAWAAFARGRGLQYTPPDVLEGRPYGEAEGEVEGLACSLRLRSGKPSQQVMTLAIPGAPAGLSVGPQFEVPRLAGVLGFGFPAGVETGDEAFDRAVRVHCPDEAAAHTWLDERRRGLLRALIEGRTYVNDGRLTTSCQSPDTTVEALEATLESLLSAARSLR